MRHLILSDLRNSIKECSRGVLTAPDRCYCLNQASLTRNKGRAGEFPVGKTKRSQTATEVVIK